jgi:pimeloyl-ACP methyl ester carboxylesterase
VEGKSYKRLEEIKCPVLVLAGKEDQVVPVANAVVLWKLINKQARFFVLRTWDMDCLSSMWRGL